MSEEEQIARAIALSLGQDISSESKPVKSEPPKGDTPKVVKKEVKEEKVKDEDLQPIDAEVLRRFSDKLLEDILRVLCNVRSTVYSACDLFSALAKRNGPQWRTKAITRIKEEVSLPYSCLSVLLISPFPQGVLLSE